MANQEPSFESQLQKLEDIVRKLDSEEVPLEEAIKHYEAGVKLSSKLNQVLDAAQRRVEILTSSNGETKAEPFPEEEMDPR